MMKIPRLQLPELLAALSIISAASFIWLYASEAHQLQIARQNTREAQARFTQELNDSSAKMSTHAAKLRAESAVDEAGRQALAALMAYTAAPTPASQPTPPPQTPAPAPAPTPSPSPSTPPTPPPEPTPEPRKPRRPPWPWPRQPES